MGISSAHKSSSSQHHKISTPNQFHADSALHECTFSGYYPTHQINSNLSIDVQHLPRRCYINNSQFIEQRPPGITLQALNVSCQLSLTTILGIIFNHDPHLTDKVTESGRLVQGHTAQQSYKSRQDTLAPPSMLIIDQL